MTNRLVHQSLSVLVLLSSALLAVPASASSDSPPFDQLFVGTDVNLTDIVNAGVLNPMISTLNPMLIDQFSPWLHIYLSTHTAPGFSYQVSASTADPSTFAVNVDYNSGSLSPFNGDPASSPVISLSFQCQLTGSARGSISIALNNIVSPVLEIPFLKSCELNHPLHGVTVGTDPSSDPDVVQDAQALPAFDGLPDNDLAVAERGDDWDVFYVWMAVGGVFNFTAIVNADHNILKPTLTYLGPATARPLGTGTVAAFNISYNCNPNANDQALVTVDLDFGVSFDDVYFGWAKNCTQGQWNVLLIVTIVVLSLMFTVCVGACCYRYCVARARGVEFFPSGSWADRVVSSVRSKRSASSARTTDRTALLSNAPAASDAAASANQAAEAPAPSSSSAYLHAGSSDSAAGPAKQAAVATRSYQNEDDML